MSYPTDSGLAWTVTESKQVVVSISDWGQPPDAEYTTVLLRLPGGDEVRLRPADAQRLGHALNNAGGGVLDPEP